MDFLIKHNGKFKVNKTIIENKKSQIKNTDYSFWYRRYLEGNMEVVYKILKEVQEHYENEK
jgi:hypothetical protein